MSRVVDRAWGALLFWAVLLGGSAALLGVVFDSTALATGLLASASVAAASVALVAFLWGRRAGDVTPRLLPDLSHASALAGLAFALVLLGLLLGLWLVLIGAGLLALGVGGIVREARASRATEALVRRSAEPGAGGGR